MSIFHKEPEVHPSAAAVHERLDHYKREAQASNAEGRPSIEPFEPMATGKSWGVETLVADVPGSYAGKVLKRFASGHRAGLQWHESRDESFHLYSGVVIVYWVDADSVLRKRLMRPGQTFRVPPGAIHSVQTVTDSIMFEVSNGAYPDATNVEAEWDISQAIES